MPPPTGYGRPRIHSFRESLDAIFRSGCQLRLLPHDFPRLSHLWLDAGYRGEDKGNDWVEKTLGWSMDLV